MKISKESKFSEDNNLKINKNFSIKINKFDKYVIYSKSNLNSDRFTKETNKLNVIENDYFINNNSNKNRKANILHKNLMDIKVIIALNKKIINNINKVKEKLDI